MLNTKALTRSLAFAGALTALLGSSAFAQDRYYPRTYQQVANGWANRIVEGTVAAASVGRNGEHIRLTNGMDLMVPNSVIATNQGRRWQMSLLQPGDTVRMEVYSRPGDGRDAQVRSFELLATHSGYGYNNNNGYDRNNNGYDRRMIGTVISFDRRNNMMVVQADNGRSFNVDVRSYGGQRFRRGDHVSVSGRMNNGVFIADDVRIR